jgi:hypothetical protein
MKSYKVILIILLFIFSSCSAQTSSDVFLGLEKDYPESRYLATVGEGDTRRDAEKNASAKLSLIFESHIDVNQTLNEHYEEFSSDEVSTLEYESKTTKRTNVQSNQKLLNVKYGKHGVDEVGNNFVVAYINRSETASIYDEKIENNNVSIIALKGFAENSNIKINKYAALNSASGKMNENVALMKQLAIISPYNPDFSDKISTYETIYRMKGEVANSIKFVISNDSNEDVINTLKSLLTRKGFKIAVSGDFLITPTIKYEEIDLGRKELFYGWFVNVEVMNAQKEVIFNFEKSGREGGITKTSVYSRAKFSANQELKKNFVLGFEKYLNSLLGN